MSTSPDTTTEPAPEAEAPVPETPASTGAPILLGNTSVVEPFKPDPDTDVIEHRSREDLGNQVTTITPGGGKLAEVFAEIVALWQHHSPELPAWVKSADKDLEGLLARHFGCRTGRPQDWKDGPA